MKFTPDALPTLMGSLPVSDHKEAVDIIFRYMNEIPVWPQLPCYPAERLLSQYAEGLPAIIEKEDGDVNFDTDGGSFDQELLTFFERYIEVTDGGSPIIDSIFAFSERTGRGFRAFVDRLQNLTSSPKAVKGQVTGPFTMLSSIKDSNGKMSYYNPSLREAVTKSSGLKARYQIEVLKKFCNNVIVFLDEPALAGFGSSAMVGITREQVVHDLTDAINEIHNAGGIAGVHVCANTDWSILLETPVDILSFDAYGFFDRVMLFKKGLQDFLEAGNIIAWGLVPTLDSDELKKETIESLKKRWDNCIKEFGADPDLIKKRSIITPSCGTGLLDRELSIRAIELTRSLSDRIREL